MYNVLFSMAVSYAKQCDLYAISAPSDVNMVLWTKVVVFRNAGQRLFFAGQRKSIDELHSAIHQHGHAGSVLTRAVLEEAPTDAGVLGFLIPLLR